ncbi:DNA cross-link repair protein pso2/snm1 [Armillaria borealis]|uniref:DNA cross-link repair protein pso2/snm1 n=1 Tax=Armillaria borealis TaxID=47425 RepID=A0AA39JSW6_9AGAR|nr:DNA cross-link repair protein pso2/snm1 [Armillaria borealis]
MSKKSKVSPKASSTLHDYFSRPRTSKGTTSATTPKAKVRPSQGAKQKRKFVPPPSEDIIVISDDDDAEGTPRQPSFKKRRRTLSSSSGEVEIVAVHLAERDEKAKVEAEVQLSFGKPTELLLSSSPPIILEHEDGHAEEVLAFGRPTTLLLSPEAGPSAGVDTNEVLDVDEWGTGDDEREFMDDDEVEILEDVTEQSVATVCLDDASVRRASQNLVTTDIQSHVQTCLNAKPTRPPQPNGSNAFAVLMSSHKENEAWKEASAMEDRTFRPNNSNGARRNAPFYKVLQGMPIAVDAFKYGAIPGVTAYFLTHAHSDHYTNLSSSWTNGPIYCSEGTANLIMHMLKVPKNWVHALPMDKLIVIPNTGGVQVTLIEANHCPGSSLFFFEGKQTVNAGDSTFKSAFVGSSRVFRYLHCGDFRASPRHVLHPAVKGKRIDHVYLDTTYLDPKYTFPPQPLVISACAELAKRIAGGSVVKDKDARMDVWLNAAPPKTKGKQKSDRILMVVGTYSIGKERIVKAMAQALRTKVYCDARKTAILRCQCDPELHSLLTSNPLDALVHLVPLGVITSDRLKEYVERFKGHFSRAVGFRPTGWTYTPPAGIDLMPSVSTIIARSQKNTFTHADLAPARNSTSALQLYMVPYSEHSSFSELTCFAMSFQWTKMIATVNIGSENSRQKMAKWVQKWEAERKKKGNDYIVEYRQPDYW